MPLDAGPAGSAPDEHVQFSLRLLGPLGITTHTGSPVQGLGAGKSLAMLAYISVRGGARRDELTSILWGDIPEANARNAFRQSLHRLRAALGGDVLPQDREHVAIANEGLLRVDRDAFLAACENELWEAAVSSYGGEFLEGFEAGEVAFDQWADSERVRLRSRFQEALLAAARQATSTGKLREALHFAERLVAVAPYDEEAAVFEVNSLVAAGRPSQALASIHQYAARLNDDLDIRVSPAVLALIDRLEKRRETPRSHAPAPAAYGERTKLPTFVGRESEISRLLGALSRLRTGRGGTLLVEGEAGIGKSRLLDEFVERARDLGGFLILRGREAAGGGVISYASIVEALRPIVRAAGISGASRHLLAEAARLLPELRDSFDLPSVSPLEDETGRLRLFEGVSAVIDAAAYERPVCVVLDDVQHSSASTLDLVTYLSQRLRESPVLLVLAYRPDRAASQSIERIRELIRVEAGTADQRVVLAPLSPEHTEQIVREEMSRVGSAPASDVDHIVTRSAGKPFSAIALARQAAQGELPGGSPAPLRDVLWARLQAASPSQRRVFFACSLFQRSTPLRLLAAAAHVPESATWDSAQELVRSGLFSESDDGYVIAHDSAATFLVDSSGLAGRALLAGWAADALAEQNDAADAELAPLYAMAGRSGPAFARARAGAFAAAAVGASAEVVRLLGIALTFAPNDTARREIDSLLAAFGRGRLALPSPSAATAAEAPHSDPFVVSEPAKPDDIVEPDVIVEPLDISPALPVSIAGQARATSRRQWGMSIAISIAIILAGLLTRREIITRFGRAALPDTLLLVERDASGHNQVRGIANVESRRATMLLSLTPEALGPTWIDSLSAPFTAPLVSPDRKRVAMQRVTPDGADLLVVSADRRDTIAVAPGSHNNLPLGWSPDGRALMMARGRILPDGSLDTDLYLSWIDSPTASIAIDTSASRAVTEAAWSPDGARIAWVARTGASRQRHVFVSRPDGSNVRPVAPNPADDYNIDWSPDGSLLAFTSTRSGGRRLYVYDLDNDRLWPISDRDGEDDARFSPDGRVIAFESTRDGDRAIYVRPALGGTPRRLTPPGRQMSIAEWRGPAAAYVDRLRLVGTTSLAVGDTVSLGLVMLTPGGAPVRNAHARFMALDGNIVQADTTPGGALRVVGRGAGAGRVTAFIPGWRSDTLTLLISSAQSLHIEDSFQRGRVERRWMSLGQPLPFIGTAPNSLQRALFPNGGVEWESGILLKPTLQLRSGLRAAARVFAPFSGRPSAATLRVALVVATPAKSIDTIAPRFTSLIGVQWDGASGNFTYSVGQESFSESATVVPSAASHLIGIAINADTVTFVIDREIRWRSSLKFLGEGSATPVQLWIGGHATASSVAVSKVTVDLLGRPATR